MAETPPSAPTADDIAQRLAAVVAKRGYLLPHHGMLAVAAPDLLAAYDATYTAMTLTRRYLTEHDKEFVWIGILTVTEEAIATHHLRKFKEAGGTGSEAETAIRLAALGLGPGAFEFVAAHWEKHLPDFDRARAWRETVAAAVAGRGVSPGLVELAMAAICTCRRRWWELRLHIEGAYAAGVPELELAEALGLTMFPGSVPNFVDACGVWRDMIAAGDVDASPGFHAWATFDGPPPPS